MSCSITALISSLTVPDDCKAGRVFEILFAPHVANFEFDPLLECRQVLKNAFSAASSLSLMQPCAFDIHRGDTSDCG